MPAIPLKVKRPPASDAADPVPDAGKPLFRGTGDTDYVCGNCGAVIALGMGPTQRVPFDSAVPRPAAPKTNSPRAWGPD
jgi:hypothetical protein